MTVMTGHTVVNLKEVEDSAPKFGYAPNMEARFATKDLELENSGISYQRLAPDFRMPFGHKHERQEELYLVVAGSGRVKLDHEIVGLRQWDAIRVPPEVTRCFEGGPDGIEYVAIGAPNTGGPATDTAPIPGWWED
jgi:mannose-6-phosphate isomerase-like protein (cupin superfamily)